MAKNWGKDVVPKDQWIDPEKSYYTRDGHRVEYIQIVMENSVGAEVTYPVKGTVVLRDSPRKTEYHIWSLEGKRDIVWGNHSHGDLVLESEVLHKHN